ncbi:hypothetical protein KSP40_PGU005713 [Platanthera guangdongensis]|uniref:Uncharacterized protein n=1 Tax=Platanthera guangdongensis TaxID=2320717 RepID=A0ABR2MTZ8_9ASPA
MIDRGSGVVHRERLKGKQSSETSLSHRNIRSPIRKVEILLALLKFHGHGDSVLQIPSSVTTCPNELYIMIHLPRILLDFCSQWSQGI